MQLNWPQKIRLFYLIATITTIGWCDTNEDLEEDLIGSGDNNNNNNEDNGVNATLVFVEKLRNATVDANRKFIKLTCEIKNLEVNGSGNGSEAKVTISWRFNSAPIEKNDRIKIKASKLKDNRYRSTLRIASIDRFDRGFYDCIASNTIDRITSTAMIEIPYDPIHAPTSSISSTSSISQNLNAHYDEITTLPHAPISLFDGILDDQNKQLEEAIRNGQTTFDIPTKKTDTIIKTKKVEKFHNFHEPLCQIYKGQTCRKYLENRYVFVQPPYTQQEIENKLSSAFVVISQSNDISSSCNKFAVPSLCFSAFPLCIDTKQISAYQLNLMKSPQPFHSPLQFQGLRNELATSLRRICKDDCLLLETELCSKEYAIAKRHPVIGQTLELEECQFLPNETETSSKNCLGLGVYHAVNKDDNCYWDAGELYRGIANVSQNGSQCLRWSHQFQIPLSEHPELTGHNYCRNPGGVEPSPFCYVDQNIRELCKITKCAYIFGIYLAGSFIGLGIVIATLVGVFCCRKKNKTRNLQNMNIQAATKNIYGNPGPNSPMEMNTLLPPNIPPQRQIHPSKNGYASVPQYTHKEVHFIEELGEGAFGKVYKGELKTKNGKIFVAVKSLKENANAKTQADFQREIQLISDLKHPNIICLLGVVVKQEPMCMLFEFMSEGDLHEFLIANSPGEGRQLSQVQFLHIAIQIAQGMEYLSENHYVHRDLAARNCLVSKDLVVKISDFGLSRDMYSCDYYRVQSKSLLPVRWMPPESILYGKFTTESDVWSYGVVLWEIYSYGLQPYYGRNNQEVINMIRYRELLPAPDACPSYCYSLMVECWAELAIRRPSFAEIAHRLRVWKQNAAAVYLAASKTPESHAASHNNTSNSLHKFGHGSRSSEGAAHSEPCTWERSGSLAKSGRNESQSSLTSRSSSLGGKTQSTSLSNENGRHGHRKSHHNHGRRGDESLERLNPKNTVVSSKNGDFEIKISQ